MHTQAKDKIKQQITPAFVGQHWEVFLPATQAQHDISSDDARAALFQAENIIRAQEDRIRMLEAQALTDELTGLANRRGFAQFFERELGLARRDAAHNGALVMVDLDGFKGINDQYGHQAGDAYLRAVAHALRDLVRATDIVARLGGDEFGVLLTSIDEKNAARRIAKLELAFCNRWLLWNGKRLPLRASFGLAPYNAGDRVDAVLHAADVRLYAHKARNKTLEFQIVSTAAV